MLIIRPNQFDQYLQHDPERFIDHLLNFITETMPDEIRGIPPHLVREQIRVAIARARKYGLTKDEQVMGFVSVMFEIAPNFDEEPVLQRILTNTRLSPSERWEALFADTPELNAAWERAAHPKFYDANAWIDSGNNGQTGN
jgi:hypothetical protein